MAERSGFDMLSLSRKLVLASGNAGKLREVGSMLQPLGWTILPQSDWKLPEAVEDGSTFIENALIKARHAARYTGLPALADDSGLVVDALAGAPGILSARFAGEHADDRANNLKLLEMMRDIPLKARTAHFYCAMVVLLYEKDPAPLVATGTWFGSIAESASGSGGFGYDPLFWVESHACTSAELESGLKNRLSHRGKAMAALMTQLKVTHGD